MTDEDLCAWLRVAIAVLAVLTVLVLITVERCHEGSAHDANHEQASCCSTGWLASCTVLLEGRKTA
jgi:hypothetical protein